MVHREYEGSLPPDQSPPDSWGGLISRLKDVNASLRKFYELRDARQTNRLTLEEKVEEQRLNAEKGRVLVDILLLRDTGVIPDRFPVTITQDPDEVLHPFSQNIVELQIPIAEAPLSRVITKTFLHQLRKPGVIHTSDEARNLIGFYHTESEYVVPYLNRSVNEVEDIINAEKRVRMQNGPAEDRYYLNRLRNHLVLDRFVGLRIADRLPLGYTVGVGFLSADHLPDNPGQHLVEISVATPEHTSNFTLFPPWAYRHVPELQMKLNKSLYAIGGYDYYDYRQSG